MEQRITDGLVPVESSNLRAVGYHGTTLTIAFRSGGTYTYADVPQEVYDGFFAAHSKCRYFHQEVRGRYGYNKRGTEE